MPTTPPSSTPPTVSPMKSRPGLVRIINAFFYSLSGLALAFRHESAFRQELMLVLVLVPWPIMLPFSAVERVLLLGSALLVLVVELLNSSVEAAIDRISFDHHPLSKQAKDLGSAAVLITLLMLAVTWGLIVGPRLWVWMQTTLLNHHA